MHLWCIARSEPQAPHHVFASGLSDPLYTWQLWPWKVCLQDLLGFPPRVRAATASKRCCMSIPLRLRKAATGQTEWWSVSMSLAIPGIVKTGWGSQTLYCKQRPTEDKVSNSLSVGGKKKEDKAPAKEAFGRGPYFPFGSFFHRLSITKGDKTTQPPATLTEQGLQHPSCRRTIQAHSAGTTHIGHHRTWSKTTPCNTWSKQAEANWYCSGEMSPNQLPKTDQQYPPNMHSLVDSGKL